MPQKGYPHIPDGPKTSDELIERLNEAAAALSRLQARLRAKDEALTAARAMIQTRETIDELSWGKRSSPATRLLAKIDAALAQPEEVK